MKKRNTWNVEGIALPGGRVDIIMSNTSGKFVTGRNNKFGNIIWMVYDRGEYLSNVATKIDPDILSGGSGARGCNMDFMERAQDFKTITDGVLSVVSSGNKHTSDASNEEENEGKEIGFAFNLAERLLVVDFWFLAWIVWLAESCLVDRLLRMSLHDRVTHHHLNDGLLDLLQSIMNGRWVS